MANSPGDRRCLICLRVALEKSSKDTEKLVSNAALLQDFFYFFRVNVLDSEVHDLSTSFHFCPTCEQFIAEYGSIQTQMTQLTRRAAHLKATLSALLLSAHELLEQNRNEDVTEIINNRIQNSQDIQLPHLLQQTVDGIREELRKKYSVRVMLDKIRLPLKHNLDALPVSYDDVDEASDHAGFVMADDSDVEFLPSASVLDDKVTTGHLLEINEEANSDHSRSQDSVDSREMSFKARNSRKRKRNERGATIVRVGPNTFKYKEMSFQRNEEDQTYTCDACGFKSRPSMKSIRDHLYRHLRKKELRETSERQPVRIPNGSNGFKYNGYDVWFNGQHQQYYCGVCNFKCHASVWSIQNHIRLHHYTAEDKIKFTAVRLSDTEWLYGGKYKIIKMEEKKFKCALCGSVSSRHNTVVAHIRSQHVETEGPEKVIHLPEKDTPSLNVSRDTPVIKVEPMLTDNATVDELRNHSEFGAGASDEEYLPREDPFSDAITPGQFLEIRIKTEDEADCDNTNLQDSEEINVNGTADETWDQGECDANIQIPFVPKIDPLSVGENNDDEPWDHSQFGAEDFVENYWPRDDELDDEESSDEILGFTNEADEEANCDDSNSQCSVDSKAMNVKAGPRKTNWCPDKLPRKYQKMVVPDGPNKFKYNGHDLRLNDEDQCYYCGACAFKGNTSMQSVLSHIRGVHYTDEDKRKWMAVQTSETEWIYGGEYKIVRVGEKFQCVSCGFTASELHTVNNHIRATHIDVEGADKVAPLQVTDKPSVKDLTPIEGKYNNSVPYTFNPAENTYTCGICQTKVPTSRSNLGHHIRNCHTEAALSVTCEICGKEISNQKGYKRHLQSHQAVLKNCPTCNKKFYCPKTFNRHVKIHVLGEAAKKYQCEHCGDKFYLRAHYRQHVRKHTGELPYECGVCGKKYRINTSLASHRRKVHGVQKDLAHNFIIRINE